MKLLKNLKKINKFLTRVNKTSTCWLWKGSIMKTGGYGQVHEVGFGHWRAHRLSWELFRGRIPRGFQVLHGCDIPGCVKPSHLFLGTQLDNMRDCKRKGRTNKSYGKMNSNGKLSDKEVSYIRKNCIRVKQGQPGSNVKDLANKFGITIQFVSRIAAGTSRSEKR